MSTTCYSWINSTFIVKIKTQVSFLVDALYTFIGDTRVEFGLNKGGLLVLKKGNVKCIDALMILLGKQTGYTYSEIWEKDKLMLKEKKEKSKRSNCADCERA